MNGGKVADIKSRFDTFSKKAHLDVLLPKDDNFDAASVLRDGSPEELQRAPSRRHLFFDEKTKLQIVLRTSQTGDTLRTLLSHLELVIAAHATNSEPGGSGSASSTSGKHDIASGKCHATENVTVISVGDTTYAVWKPTLHLIRPKARLQRPAIYFTAHLSLKPEPESSDQTPKKTYLPSCEPLPANVLETLQYDPALGGSGRQIYLSETRVTKVSPSTPQLEHLVRPLRGATKRAFPALPIIFTRVTYSVLPDAIIASLRLETSQLIPGEVALDNVSLVVSDADTKLLSDVSWPKTARAGDEMMLLYRVSKHSGKTGDDSLATETASVSLKATATLEQGSQVNIETQWQNPVGTSCKDAAAPRKWARPPSAVSTTTPARLASHASSTAASDSTSRRHTREGEVVFTFTASPTVGYQEQLNLRVHCVNKSNETRQFALVAAGESHERGSSASGVEAPSGKTQARRPAPGFEAPLKPTVYPDVLVLTPDVRVGLLPAGTCAEATLKYRTVAKGVLDLGSVRIIDMETKQTLDIADLPDVVCLEYPTSAAIDTL